MFPAHVNFTYSLYCIFYLLKRHHTTLHAMMEQMLVHTPDDSRTRFKQQTALHSHACHISATVAANPHVDMWIGLLAVRKLQLYPPHIFVANASAWKSAGTVVEIWHWLT